MEVRIAHQLQCCSSEGWNTSKGTLIISVHPLCSLCLCGCCISHSFHHRDTENTEGAQRRRMARVVVSLIGYSLVALMLAAWPTAASNQMAPVKVEGCVACHGL